MEIQLLDLQIPKVVDYRDQVTLNCSYMTGFRGLYSVNWYKDNKHFYRFKPNGESIIHFFPVNGVYLTNSSLSGKHCNSNFCAITLTNLSLTHSSGTYKCEVTAKGPEYYLTFNSSYLNVFALLKNPKIECLNSYQISDYLSANCTAGPSYPSPMITWRINGEEMSTTEAEQISFTETDPSTGLISKKLSIGFLLKNEHFFNGEIELSCIVYLLSPKTNQSVINLTTRYTSMKVYLKNDKNNIFQWLSFSSATNRFPNLFLFIIPLMLIN